MNSQPTQYYAGAVNGGYHQTQSQQHQQQQMYQQQQPAPQPPQSRTSGGPGPSSGQIPMASEKKPADYVTFDRQPASVFSKDAIARATAAKMKMELFYKVAVESAIDRNNR
jgi:protein-serine/threonine kinase